MNTEEAKKVFIEFGVDEGSILQTTSGKQYEVFRILGREVTLLMRDENRNHVIDSPSYTLEAIAEALKDGVLKYVS